MAGNVKVSLPDGRVVDGVDVGVDESTERWTEVKLRDGTILRVKLAVISAARAVNAFDNQGNPIYSLNMTPVIATVEVPSELKKRSN